MWYSSTPKRDKYSLTDGNRGKFLRDYCDSCQKPIYLDGCGSTFRSVLQPIECPSELAGTHTLCPFCLDLHPRVQRSGEHCIFAQRQLQLRAGGWSTLLSNNLLRSLRSPSFLYYEPFINLLHILLLELAVEDAVIVPIPLGSARGTDLWLEIVHSSTRGIENVEVLSLLVRKKQHSTRKNVAQIRERIAHQEYNIDDALVHHIKDRLVILLDDNVTTGNTILHCSSLIQQHKPKGIIPLVIERHISARLLQRCTSPVIDTCQYYMRKNEKV